MSPPPQAPVSAEAVAAGATATVPGTLVVVPLAPASGDPGGPVVAVSVKSASSSMTIWASRAALVFGIGLAVAEVIRSATSTDVMDVLWPCIIAAYGAFTQWRRTTDNTIIGRGAPLPNVRLRG